MPFIAGVNNQGLNLIASGAILIERINHEGLSGGGGANHDCVMARA